MSKHASTAKRIAEAGGLATLAAAAAGAYFLYGSPNSSQNRKQVLTLAKKAEADLHKKLKKVKTLTKPYFDRAVKDVTEKYKTLKKLAPKQTAMVEKHLKTHWEKARKELSKFTPKTRAKKP